MSSAMPNSLAFLQKRFEEAYAKTEETYKKRTAESTQRRSIAYLLKAIAVFGGIAVAAGLNGFWSHAVGILIMVAVGTDTLFSNQKRLLLVTKASNAYKRLLDIVSHQYDQKLASILRQYQKEPKQAEEQLESMILAINENLFTEKQKIETALEEEDLKLLNSLAIEQKKE